MPATLRQDWVVAANMAQRLSPEVVALVAESLTVFQHRGRQPLQALRLALDGLSDTPASDLTGMAVACVADMASQQDAFALAVRLLRRTVVNATQLLPLSALLASDGPRVWADAHLLSLVAQSFGLEPSGWMAERGGVRVLLTGPVQPTPPPLAALSVGALKGAGLRPKLSRQDEPSTLTLALWLPCEA